MLLRAASDKRTTAQYPPAASVAIAAVSRLNILEKAGSSNMHVSDLNRWRSVMGSKRYFVQTGLIAWISNSVVSQFGISKRHRLYIPPVIAKYYASYEKRRVLEFVCDADWRDPLFWTRHSCLAF